MNSVQSKVVFIVSYETAEFAGWMSWQDFLFDYCL